jgi:hypothetical protein
VNAEITGVIPRIDDSQPPDTQIPASYRTVIRTDEAVIPIPGGKLTRSPARPTTCTKEHSSGLAHQRWGTALTSRCRAGLSVRDYGVALEGDPADYDPTAEALTLDVTVSPAA